jgi:dethiobiotin synthetase
LLPETIKNMNFIIVGIHTGIGKTICSAILTEVLGYDYWKPVQAGDLDASDSIFIKNHISNPLSKIQEEAYRLTQPMSPHAAAKIDNAEITLDGLKLPFSQNSIIVETAGGIMSPLSDTLVNLDLIKHLGLPVVLVTNDYLGSINHTLLSIEILRGANVPILGLVFSGEKVAATRTFIQQYSGLETLLEIPFFERLDRETLVNFAKESALTTTRF